MGDALRQLLGILVQSFSKKQLNYLNVKFSSDSIYDFERRSLDAACFNTADGSGFRLQFSCSSFEFLLGQALGLLQRGQPLPELLTCI